MTDQAVKKPKGKLLPKILITFIILLLIPAVAFLTLFVVNRFTLVVDVFGQQEAELAWGMPYQDSGKENTSHPQRNSTNTKFAQSQS